jgi:hypothetical protein
MTPKRENCFPVIPLVSLSPSLPVSVAEPRGARRKVQRDGRAWHGLELRLSGSPKPLRCLDRVRVHSLTGTGLGKPGTVSLSQLAVPLWRVSSQRCAYRRTTQGTIVSWWNLGARAHHQGARQAGCPARRNRMGVSQVAASRRRPCCPAGLTATPGSIRAESCWAKEMGLVLVCLRSTLSTELR